MRVEVLFMAAVIALHIAAEKCRQLVGEEGPSKSRKERFIFLDCFDVSYGSIGCIMKECVKLYFYNMRAAHAHKVKHEVAKAALREKLSEGWSPEGAQKWASEEGNAAAKRASQQVKHVIGAVISSGWDFFETIYVGGTLAEGIFRSIGAFFGADAGGVVGSQGRLGWLGSVVGSQMGSWVGARIGLMAYDVGRGVDYLFHLVHT